MAVLAHRQAGWLASLEALPLGTRLANAALSYWRYAGKAFWPADLAVYYPHPGRGVPWGLGLAAGLALTVVTGLALAGWPRRPWLGAGWLWFAGMLVPASGVVQFGDHAMADRFAYLSLAGLVLPLTWTAREIASGRPNVARALPATAVACIGLLSGITVAQVRLWRDSETLFRHTLAVTGENWCAEGNLAIVLKDQGRFAESLLHLRAAARIRPADPEVHNITGVVLGKMARHEEAIAAFSEALRLRPVYPEARRNLGHALLQLGRDAEAVAQLEDALRGLPPDPVESTNLGGALSRLGRQEQALAWFRAALELQPGLLEARFNEGCALLELGRFREAAASFAAVVRDQPGDGEARTYLAKALAGAAGHDREEARRHRR
jgi:tetratricopeptide (TPR) repeat protein